MKDFEEYLYKMGYSWNDFDRTYEMASLIEQYADERVKQALRIANVVQQSEQLSCETCKFNSDDWDDNHPCANCAGFEFWVAT